MICKQCHTNLEDGTTVCPVCGCKQEGETVAKSEKKKLPKKAITVLCAVALFLVVGIGTWHLINGGWALRKNDVTYRDKYTVTDIKAVSEADKVVATVGSKELTNSELQIYYWMEVYNFLDRYGSYLSNLGLDLTKPMSEQYVQDSGTTWEQYFLDAALMSWHNYQCIELAAEAENFVMSETLRKQLEDVKVSLEENCVELGFATAEEMIQADMGPGATVEAYINYMNLYYGGAEYVQNLYDNMEFERDSLQAYYEKNADTITKNYGVNKDSGKLVDVRHILLIPEGGTKNEDGSTTHTLQEWDACLAKAEKILKQWQEGEATAMSFGELANLYSEDPGSNTNGGLYTFVQEGEMVPTFNDWCFDENRQEGDVGIVQTEYGFHVMYYVCGDEAWIRCSEEEMLAEACKKIISDTMASNPIEVKYRDIVLGEVPLTK